MLARAVGGPFAVLLFPSLASSGGARETTTILRAAQLSVSFPPIQRVSNGDGKAFQEVYLFFTDSPPH